MRLPNLIGEIQESLTSLSSLEKLRLLGIEEGTKLLNANPADPSISMGGGDEQPILRYALTNSGSRRTRQQDLHLRVLHN